MTNTELLPEVSEELKSREIRFLLEEKALADFDVRDHVLKEVAKDAEEDAEEIFKEIQKKFLVDWKIYCDPKSNILLKTVIGKKWAYRFDYDYDASLFTNCVFQKIMFFDKEDCTIRYASKRKSGYEYRLDSDKILYRGDTMNSWSTTLGKYVRMKGFRNVDDFLSIPENCMGEALPSYVENFMEAVYTIGNFIPLPDGCNSPRGIGCTKDYWDLALKCIYDWYQENPDLKCSNLDNTCLFPLCKGDPIENMVKWLVGFKSWDDFIENLLLQDYTEQQTRPYGHPKEYWDGHFSGPALPSSEEQMEAFFTHAAECIKARSKRMVNKLNELKKETNS